LRNGIETDGTVSEDLAIVIVRPECESICDAPEMMQQLDRFGHVIQDTKCHNQIKRIWCGRRDIGTKIAVNELGFQMQRILYDQALEKGPLVRLNGRDLCPGLFQHPRMSTFERAKFEDSFSL